MEKSNVKCSACGSDVFCEQCEKEAGDFKHLCLECYRKGVQSEEREKTHLCIPPEKLAEEYERFLGQMTQSAFSDMWDEEKKKLKGLSKQKLAQTCFFEGARFMLALMRKMSQEGKEEKK